MINIIITFLRALLWIEPATGNMPPVPKAPAVSTRFQTCLEHVLKHEGGYVDHPSDPGGVTQMGITFATLAAWRGTPITKDDVRNLTVAEAGAIYRKNYWDKVRGDALPNGVDLVTFDAAVNSGPGNAARWLQSAVGVPQDGAIGPLTLAAVAKAAPTAVIADLCAARMAFLRSLKTWPVFGRGWSRRVSDVEAAALRDAV